MKFPWQRSELLRLLPKELSYTRVIKMNISTKQIIVYRSYQNAVSQTHSSVYNLSLFFSLFLRGYTCENNHMEEFRHLNKSIRLWSKKSHCHWYHYQHGVQKKVNKIIFADNFNVTFTQFWKISCDKLNH